MGWLAGGRACSHAPSFWPSAARLLDYLTFLALRHRRDPPVVPQLYVIITLILLLALRQAPPDETRLARSA